jgi:peptidyl-dipeptidase Dcp
MTGLSRPSEENALSDNPFFETWNTPFGAPPFSRIGPEHFVPAYERAFAEHEAEIAMIAGQQEPPTFDNTIIALENAGRALQRVDDVFGQLCGTDSNDTLLAIERDISPRTAAHWNKVRMNAGLFARLDALYGKRDSLGLTAEQKRVLERHHQVSPRGRGARTGQEATPRCHRRTAGGARHSVQPERAGRRAVLHDGA